MKYWYCFIIVLWAGIACEGDQYINSDLLGKWKVYKTRLNDKDISKRSDPTNENGFEFRADGTYETFGNLGHQDHGRYKIEEDRLTFISEEGKSRSTAQIDLKQDTLYLNFKMDDSKVLYISLAR